MACDSATTGDAGTRPRQDGRFGRDVAALAKVGGGAAGFDFTPLDAAHLASKPFAPLPLMGVPGWCADNANPAFYADAAVFRPTNRVGMP